MAQIVCSYIVEWNAGRGWVTSSAHTFWNPANAVACYNTRAKDEKLGKWPMRLVEVNTSTDTRRTLRTWAGEVKISAA